VIQPIVFDNLFRADIREAVRWGRWVEGDLRGSSRRAGPGRCGHTRASGRHALRPSPMLASRHRYRRSYFSQHLGPGGTLRFSRRCGQGGVDQKIVFSLDRAPHLRHSPMSNPIRETARNSRFNPVRRAQAPRSRRSEALVRVGAYRAIRSGRDVYFSRPAPISTGEDRECHEPETPPIP